MRARTLFVSFAGIAAAAIGFIALTAARRTTRVERVDFDKVVRATAPVFDARLAPASDASVKEFRIPIKDATIEIAKGVTYQGWTFGGTVPGPVLRVPQGDPRSRNGCQQLKLRCRTLLIFTPRGFRPTSRIAQSFRKTPRSHSSSQRAIPAPSWCTAARLL